MVFHYVGVINIYTLDTFLCTHGVLSAQLLYSKDLYVVDLAVLHLPEVQREVSRSIVKTAKDERIRVIGLHGGAGGIWQGEDQEGKQEGLYERSTTGGSVNYSIVKPVDPDLVGTQIFASTDDGTMVSWNINGLRQVSEDNWRVLHKNMITRPKIRSVRYT